MPMKCEELKQYFLLMTCKGRKIFTPGIEKAAEFISNEFKQTGLKPFGAKDYRQSFIMLKTKLINLSCTVNG